MCDSLDQYPTPLNCLHAILCLLPPADWLCVPLCLQSLLGQVDLAFLSAYAVGMFFAGHLGDRTDLRLFLSIGMIGSGIFCCLFGWVSGIAEERSSWCWCVHYGVLRDMEGRAQLLSFPQKACTLVGEQWRLQLTLLVLCLQAYLWDMHSMFVFRLAMVSRSTHLSRAVLQQAAVSVRCCPMASHNCRHGACQPDRGYLGSKCPRCRQCS